MFRYNPALKEEGKNPFTLDSKTPDMSLYQGFLKGEVRYTSLALKNPAKAEKMFAKSEQFAVEKYQHLQRLVALYSVEE